MNTRIKRTRDRIENEHDRLKRRVNLKGQFDRWMPFMTDHKQLEHEDSAKFLLDL